MNPEEREMRIGLLRHAGAIVSGWAVITVLLLIVKTILEDAWTNKYGGWLGGFKIIANENSARNFSTLIGIVNWCFYVSLLAFMYMGVVWVYRRIRIG